MDKESHKSFNRFRNIIAVTFCIVIRETAYDDIKKEKKSQLLLNGQLLTIL